MESNEEVSKNIKQVRFAEETKEQHENALTPMKKPSMKAILKQWIHRSREGEYDQLKQELLSWNQKGISTRRIFTQEGSLLLSWAAGTARDYKPLQFICENVEKSILQEILAQDDFHILKKILSVESGLDESHKASQEELEVRHKKFTLLLNIDSESVQRFVHENDAAEWLGKEVKVNFSRALDEYRMMNHTSNLNDI